MQCILFFTIMFLVISFLTFDVWLNSNQQSLSRLFFVKHILSIRPFTQLQEYKNRYRMVYCTWRDKLKTTAQIRGTKIEKNTKILNSKVLSIQLWFDVILLSHEITSCMSFLGNRITIIIQLMFTFNCQQQIMHWLSINCLLFPAAIPIKFSILLKISCSSPSHSFVIIDH